MNLTLDYLRGNRKFLIPDFIVYGDYTEIEGGVLFGEQYPGGKRIMFAHNYISENEQPVNFGNLYDYKNNPLPNTLSNPKVIILPKNEVFCFIVGTETETGFKIAKTNSSENGLVDLLIIEME